jgi:hypothetical protein
VRAPLLRVAQIIAVALSRLFLLLSRVIFGLISLELVGVRFAAGCLSFIFIRLFLRVVHFFLTWHMLITLQYHYTAGAVNGT